MCRSFIRAAGRHLPYAPWTVWRGERGLRLSPWDVAAGSLLVQEAGGLVTDVQGGPLRLDAPGSLLAASTSVYEAIKAAIGSVDEA